MTRKTAWKVFCHAHPLSNVYRSYALPPLSRSFSLSRSLSLSRWSFGLLLYEMATLGKLNSFSWIMNLSCKKNDHALKDRFEIAISLSPYICFSTGEAPFAEIPVNELLQFHQRGKTLRKPSNCSNTLWVSFQTSCSHLIHTWCQTSCWLLLNINNYVLTMPYSLTISQVFDDKELLPMEGAGENLIGRIKS